MTKIKLRFKQYLTHRVVKYQLPSDLDMKFIINSGSNASKSFMAMFQRFKKTQFTCKIRLQICTEIFIYSFIYYFIGLCRKISIFLKSRSQDTSYLLTNRALA